MPLLFTDASVTFTSTTSSRVGRSNMTSVRISSTIARSPRAPVPRFNAFVRSQRNAASRNVSSTSSSSNNFLYCFVSAFLAL